MTQRFKAGDFVRFDAADGSTGQISSLNHYGGYYVMWVYGRNLRGNVMTALASVDDKKLREATEDDYIKIRDGMGFQR